MPSSIGRHELSSFLKGNRIMSTISALAGSTNILFPSNSVTQRVGRKQHQPSLQATQVNALDHRQVARNQQGDTFVSSARLNARPATPKVTEQISKPVLDAPASAFASFGSMLGNIFSLNN
jgi:hypothetical protein